MRAIKPMELRNNQKEILDLAYSGEILLVARPAKKNVVVLSEEEFNRREKALRTLNASADEATRQVKTKAQLQNEALKAFRAGIREITDEPIDEEFEAIVNNRVNITKGLDL